MAGTPQQRKFTVWDDSKSASVIDDGGGIYMGVCASFQMRIEFGKQINRIKLDFMRWKGKAVWKKKKLRISMRFRQITQIPASFLAE